MQQVDPDAAAGARERPSEAPERLRADKYQGGGTQGGKEATWRAAAGSAAWIRDQLPEILRRIRMRYQVISCSSCRRSWMCSRWIRMQLPGRGRGLQRLRRGSGRINTRAEAHRAEKRPRGEQQRDPLPGSVISCRRSSAGSGCGTR